MLKSQKFIEKNREKFLDELILLLKIPSVSADPKFTDDVNKCAEIIALSLKNIGIEKV